MMRSRVARVAFVLCIVSAGGCSSDDADPALDEGEVSGEVLEVLGPSDDGGAALVVSLGDGRVVEVLVASEEVVHCGDGAAVAYADLVGRTATATPVPGSTDESADGQQAVEASDVSVDC